MNQLIGTWKFQLGLGSPLNRIESLTAVRRRGGIRDVAARAGRLVAIFGGIAGLVGFATLSTVGKSLFFASGLTWLVTSVSVFLDSRSKHGLELQKTFFSLAQAKLEKLGRMPTEEEKAEIKAWAAKEAARLTKKMGLISVGAPLVTLLIGVAITTLGAFLFPTGVMLPVTALGALVTGEVLKWLFNTILFEPPQHQLEALGEVLRTGKTVKDLREDPDHKWSGISTSGWKWVETELERIKPRL